MLHTAVAALLLLALASTARAAPAEPVDYYPDWFPSAQFAGLYVAIDHGYYRDAGFDVTVHPFAFGQKASQQIAATADHLALGSVEGYIFLQYRARGEDLLALAAVLQESPAGLISLPSKPITNPRALVGHRLGIHAFSRPLFNWFLRQAGTDPEHTPLIQVGNDLGVLTRGEVDAVQGFAIDELLQIRANGHADAAFLSFADLGFPSYSQVLYTSRQQQTTRGPALARFLAATRRGWEHALAHPDGALRALRRRQSDIDPALQRAGLEALRPYVAPAGQPPLAPLSAEKWRRLTAISVEMGIVSRAEDPAQFLVLPAPVTSTAP